MQLGETEAFWKDQIERHYRLAVCSVELVQLGANITLEIGADTGRFFLRLYRAQGRSRIEIDAEMRALLAFRSARDVHVSKPVELRGGAYVFSCPYQQHQRWAALFTSAPGCLPTPNAVSMRRLGKALGILHKQMEPVFPVGRPFDPEAAISRAVENVSAVGSGVRLIGPKIKEAGAAAITALHACGQLQAGFCHGDIWLGKNVHFLGERVTFFDFDDCVEGPLAIDLARPITGLAYAGLTDFAAQSRAFLDAYETVHRLTVNDVMAIPALIRLYEIELLGLLAGSHTLKPHEWNTVIDHFVQRVEDWSPGGTANIAILACAKGRTG